MTSPLRRPITVELDVGTFRAVRALARVGGMSPYIRRITEEHVRTAPIGRREITPFAGIGDEGGGP